MFDPVKHCHDCGSALRWAWGKSDVVSAPDHLCRRCAAKGGDNVFVEVDPEKLEKLVGFEEAQRLLRASVRDS